MVLKLGNTYHNLRKLFENDVKMYGTQTSLALLPSFSMFENDVKMYGTQTIILAFASS